MPEGVRTAPLGAWTVLRAGVRYLGSLLRGAAPVLDDRRRFALTVAHALRPHFFVFPAGAALTGASAAGAFAEPWRVALASAAAGLGWGVGQLLNDLLDVEADAIDAPDRPAVRGLLPLGPTAAVGLVLALLVTLATLAVHPGAVVLAALAALLLAAYSPAKRVPLLGNLAHGALVATAAAIGLAAADPGSSLERALAAGWHELVYAGIVAALYLQSNYEKDRAGDAEAGYRTLAHVLGVRPSAAARLITAAGLAALALHWELTPDTPGRLALGLGALGTLAGTLPSLAAGSDRAALAGYRWSVHATALFMLAPAARLSPLLVVALGAGSALLVERAFQRSDNP